jgi:hypothetical protein
LNNQLTACSPSSTSSTDTAPLYPGKGKADALAERRGAGKIPGRIEDVAIKGKGRWHHVLPGKLKTRTEARKYSNDHKIEKLYPQSFMQISANI